MYNSEYGQPLVHTETQRTPVVAGFTTQRFFADIPVQGITANTANSLKLTLTNRGLAAATIQPRQADTTSGARTNLGSAVAIAAGGTLTVTAQATKPILEMHCTAGESELETVVQSQLRYRIGSFDRLDALYPANLWQATYESVQS